MLIPTGNKMKNLICQVSIKGPKIGNLGSASMHSYTEELFETCIADGREYANKINAEYYLMTEPEYDLDIPKPTLIAPYQRNALWTNPKFDEYDNIVYMDADYSPNVHTMPDIFEVMASSDHIFFAVPDNKYDPKTGEMKVTKAKIFKELGLREDYKYFNNGFMCMKRQLIEETKHLIDDAMSKSYSYEMFEQDAINKIIHDKYFEYGHLHKNWNGVFSIDEPNFAIHYAGMSKQKFTVPRHRQLQEKKLLSDKIWHTFDPRVDKVEAPSLEGFI